MRKEVGVYGKRVEEWVVRRSEDQGVSKRHSVDENVEVDKNVE